MWFNPREITLTANSAKTANFKEKEVKEISEISEISKWGKPEQFIKCVNCLHFKSNNAHGRGGGVCLSGGDYGTWSESQHQCTKFDACVVIQDYVIKEGAEIVTCYTPNGKAIEIEARNKKHAIFLKQMNPKPA